MKTVTILLSFIVNDYDIVHLAVYETKFDSCFQAEQTTLDHAWEDYIDTGKADQISVESCRQFNTIDYLPITVQE